ncbi:hypothetical protein B0H14DRAFT_2650827 [Mycena olivaceomarginata]|nr:hypothetical protein B0H14DRAFT_2650827 [Mycena olivaceomarginata]
MKIPCNPTDWAKKMPFIFLSGNCRENLDTILTETGSDLTAVLSQPECSGIFTITSDSSAASPTAEPDRPAYAVGGPIKSTKEISYTDAVRWPWIPLLPNNAHLHSGEQLMFGLMKSQECSNRNVRVHARRYAPVGIRVRLSGSVGRIMSWMREKEDGRAAIPRERQEFPEMYWLQSHRNKSSGAKRKIAAPGLTSIMIVENSKQKWPALAIGYNERYLASLVLTPCDGNEEDWLNHFVVTGEHKERTNNKWADEKKAEVPRAGLMEPLEHRVPPAPKPPVGRPHYAVYSAIRCISYKREAIRQGRIDIRVGLIAHGSICKILEHDSIMQKMKEGLDWGAGVSMVQPTPPRLTNGTGHALPTHAWRYEGDIAM